MDPAALDALFDRLRDSHTNDLVDWLRIPSISSDPSAAPQVHAAARWLADHLQGAGLQTQLIPTDGYPLVYAQTAAVPGAPVVLVYGHYDVQPVEPLDQWTTPPFEPDLRDGNLYARGATDDKGQVLTHVQSVVALLRQAAAGGGQRPVAELPVQVKFLIEGEEEVGSRHLEQMLPELAERIACDVVVISDSSQFAPGQPAITYGLRGLATFQLSLRGPRQDLHSGSFGGAVLNPAIALCKLLAALVDDAGRIQLEGFYDAVRPLADAEREQFAALPHDDAQFAGALGVPQLAGESGYTTLERKWARPTFDINGLTSGHQGAGVKTIIPAVASAKLSFRLVPDQDPQQVADSLQRFVDRHCPPGVTATLTPDHGAPGMVSGLDSPYMQAARTAIAHAFGVPPVMIREGGSIPIVQQFQQTLGVPCLLLGWGLNDDNAHSPNEKFCLNDYYRGIKASAYLWYELGKVKPDR